MIFIIEILFKEIEAAKEEVGKATDIVKEAEAAVKEQKDQLAKQNSEINSRTVAKEKIAKSIEDWKLAVQEMNHKVKSAESDLDGAKVRVKNMLTEHQWIKDDRHAFGKPNTQYDFKANNPQEAGKRIQKLEGSQEKLAKTVNTRAMNMLEKAEEQYSDLLKKKEIVEADKAKITETIKELDIMKKVLVCDYIITMISICICCIIIFINVLFVLHSRHFKRV